MTAVRPTPARLLVLLLCLLALTAGLLPATAPPAEASSRAEQQLLQLINAERSKAGKRALRPSSELSTVARRWSRTMASDRRLRHRSNLQATVNRHVTTRWTRIGENVGYARVSGASERDLVRRVHRNLMRSSAHRRNILGDYNRVGVGIVVDKRGTMWVTQNFVKVR